MEKRTTQTSNELLAKIEDTDGIITLGNLGDNMRIFFKRVKENLQGSGEICDFYRFCFETSQLYRFGGGGTHTLCTLIFISYIFNFGWPIELIMF